MEVCFQTYFLCHRENVAKDPGKPFSLQIYWKIGVTTPDVNEAVSRLRQSGVDVGDGHQFLDIAFLTDIIADPGGFGIEILQHDFPQNFV